MQQYKCRIPFIHFLSMKLHLVFVQRTNIQSSLYIEHTYRQHILRIRFLNFHSMKLHIASALYREHIHRKHTLRINFFTHSVVFIYREHICREHILRIPFLHFHSLRLHVAVSIQREHILNMQTTHSTYATHSPYTFLTFPLRGYIQRCVHVQGTHSQCIDNTFNAYISYVSIPCGYMQWSLAGCLPSLRFRVYGLGFKGQGLGLCLAGQHVCEYVFVCVIARVVKGEKAVCVCARARVHACM